MEQLFDDLEDFGSFDDAISGDVRDPYTELARLRREEPVQRLETSGALPHEESLPMFIVYRHEDVQQMLRDNETFSSAAVIAAFGPVLGEGVMLGMDEPIHGRLRSLVSKAFTQKSLARWQDELVGRVANSLIDNFAPNGKADLVKEFTFDYPSQIIAGLLGLPEKDYPQFQRWSISLLSWLMNPERGLAASAALCDYFAPILDARRAEPKDDLISALGAAEIDGEKLADEEIFSFLRLLLPAGVETTYRSLGSLLFGLLVGSGAIGRDPRRPLAAAAGHRRGRAVGTTAADHHPGDDPRHRTRRGADPGRGDGDADAGFGEPARGSLPGSRHVQHSPTSQGKSGLGARRARLPGHASGPARNAHGHQSSAGPAAESAAGPRRKRPAHPRASFPVADVAAGAVRCPVRHPAEVAPCQSASFQ